MLFTFKLESDDITQWYMYILAGACGFGEYGRKMNWYDGRVAGVSGLWGNGVGCGTCYQVRTFLKFHDFFSITNVSNKTILEFMTEKKSRTYCLTS